MSSVFDFETGPQPHHLILERSEPFTPPPHPGEFDPSTVKCGNIGGPESEKGKKKIADARAEHESVVASYEADCAAAKLAYESAIIKNAALDPTLGQLLAIGVYDLAADKYMLGTVSESRSEKSLIEKFWQIYVDHRKAGRKLIGHNILEFDLPFITRRSWILGIDVPASVREGRYFDRLFVDIRSEWLCGQHFSKCSSSLDHISKIFEVGEKNGDGALFYEMLTNDRDVALEYLRNDLELTASCAKRMGVAA